MAAHRELTAAKLSASGFQDSGAWTINGGILIPPSQLPAEPGVYAFLIGEIVHYVGLASVSLRQRLSLYAKPGPTQSTNIRINAIIRKSIDAGRPVRVFIAMPPDSEWNGFRVSGPCGLEAGMINDFDLPWNKRGVSTTKIAVPATTGKSAMAINVPRVQPSGAVAIKRAIVERVSLQSGLTEREIAVALFGRNAVQQQVNAHCRELVQLGQIERLPTSPITYRLGRRARSA